ERADGREEQQPAEAAGQPLSDQIGVDQLVVSRRGVMQGGFGRSHASLRAKIARSPAYPNRMGCDASSSAPRLFRNTTRRGASSRGLSRKVISGSSARAGVR